LQRTGKLFPKGVRHHQFDIVHMDNDALNRPFPDKLQVRGSCFDSGAVGRGAVTRRMDAFLAEFGR
jgi:hypothetical protein